MRSSDFKDEPDAFSAITGVPRPSELLDVLSLQIHKHVMKAMLKQSFVWELDGNDNVVAATGMDGFYGEVLRSAPVRGPDVEASVSEMRAHLGNTCLKQFLRPLGPLMPEKPVGIGAIWHARIAADHPFLGRATLDSELELIDVESGKDGAVAVIKSHSLAHAKDREISLGGARTSATHVDQEVEAVIRLDLGTGLVAERSVAMDGIYELEVRTPEGDSRTATARSTMTSKSWIMPARDEEREQGP